MLYGCIFYESIDNYKKLLLFNMLVLQSKLDTIYSIFFNGFNLKKRIDSVKYENNQISYNKY